MGKRKGPRPEAIHQEPSRNEGHVIVHSALNLTGASRYLRENLVPGRTGVLVLWESSGEALSGWQEVTVARPKVSAGGWARACHRVLAWYGQARYLVANRRRLSVVDINSISNVGAVIASRLLRASTAVRLYAHESPLGRWRWVYGIVRYWFRGRVITVSPYVQAELRRIGIEASWCYPAAFGSVAANGGKQVDHEYDVIFVAHPDRSKGYELIVALLGQLPRSLTAVVYLSKQPPDSRLVKLPNVTVIVGRRVTPEHYIGKLTVIATDPASVRETFSYVAADSLAAGVPVLCAPSGGLSEQIVHQVNGYFVSEYSASGFVSALDKLFRTPSMLDRLAVGAAWVRDHKVKALEMEQAHA